MIFTDFISEHQKTSEEVNTLRNQSRQADEEALQAKQFAEKLDRELAELEYALLRQVQEATSPDGKMLHTNDNARKTALAALKMSSPEYMRLLAAKDQAEADRARAERDAALYRHQAELGMERLKMLTAAVGRAS